MNFKLLTLAESTMRTVRPLVSAVEAHDRRLATQLRNAATSAGLLAAEANKLGAGHRKAQLRRAAGEANEARAALRFACAWGYLQRPQTEAADELLDQMGAILWTLTRKR